ncbi:MAG: GNAT family N-acetyltransferase [Verrucomicrobiota bacterium]
MRKTTSTKDNLPDQADLRIALDDKHACSLWWSDVPAYQDHRIGTIGAYAATDGESSKQLLNEAEESLRQNGCTMAIGPMDGNTWRNHRLVSDSSSVAPFFLEPQNPPEWPGFFEQSGWKPLSRYSSSRLALGGEAADRSRLLARLESAGTTIRCLDPSDFNDELSRIYDVCVISFRDNFLYTELSRNEFVAMYARVEPFTVARFVEVAECHGQPVGFVFALPDATEAQRTGKAKTLIVKTLAVLPERRFGGLGTILVERVQEAATQAGFTHAIHALQYEANTSKRITSRHGAERIREYTLYHKVL